MAEKTLIASLVSVICHAHTGYRRAGMAFSKGENTLKPGSITNTQLAQLKADQRLKVSVIESEELEESNKAGSGNSDSGPVDGGLLPGSLVEAIQRLDPSNTEHFTTSGKPTTEALSELMQTKVSAAERDEAWETFQTSDANLDGQSDDEEKGE
ncbi:HI1506-related protein [Vibrio alginolyticus]|uniref:HI1506-related protein n=1 Tax=Vibrio alginolyticus TaxID=663 RepID=UPI00215BD513|nr:HI1506-related protein [Vibrio alginolyticus]MCR9487228.1 HI1506-related protein [Vibrio alginolyticus]